MSEVITNQLAVIRTQSHLTQEELAKAVGVTRQTIIAIEKGNYTPSILLALKLADYFKLPVEKIFHLNKDKRDKK